jgi:hypothetical protein
MPFFRPVHSEYLTTDFADELMGDRRLGDRRKESSHSCSAQNMERDAPWTAWSKMLQQREESALRGRIALPEQNLEQNVPRTEWDCKSEPHEEVDSS